MIDMELAMRACELSAAAYSNQKQVPGAITVKVRTAKCIIVRENGVIKIAVEGTEFNVIDWLKNFWTAQTDFFGLSVHSGCASEADDLLPGICDELGPSADADEIDLYGHSQGGGVSPLLAWALTLLGYRIRNGCTFAPMRSVAKKSCKLFDSVLGDRWFSILKKNDIVPHVPPEIRYGNIGTAGTFDDDDDLEEGRSTPLRYLVNLGFLTFKKKIGKAVSEHMIGAYLKSMRKQL